MKLEVGKEYRTRNGKRAKVMGHEPLADLEPFIGYVYGTSQWAVTSQTWGEQGQWGMRANTTNDLDLVALWEEPRPKLYGWVNLVDSRTDPAVMGGVTRLLPHGKHPSALMIGAKNTWVRAPWLDEPGADDVGHETK